MLDQAEVRGLPWAYCCYRVLHQDILHFPNTYILLRPLMHVGLMPSGGVVGRVCSDSAGGYGCDISLFAINLRSTCFHIQSPQDQISGTTKPAFHGIASSASRLGDQMSRKPMSLSDIAIAVDDGSLVRGQQLERSKSSIQRPVHQWHTMHSVPVSLSARTS